MHPDSESTLYIIYEVPTLYYIWYQLRTMPVPVIRDSACGIAWYVPGV